jgi:hypothetical protein
VEKTLNVDQFQHVLQVLLTDKELKSGQGMQGNMNGLAATSDKSSIRDYT